MRTHSRKIRSSDQQTHVRLGHLMAYLLNRAMKIWPGWLFLLLGLAVADTSYGQDTGGSSLCSTIPETWTVRDGIISKKLTNYTYSGTGANLSKPIGGWDKYYAQRIITEKESNSSTYTKVSTLTELKAALSSATKGDTVFVVGNAEILITEKLVIRSGVTLASNRGQALSNVSGSHVSDGFALGALLHIDDLVGGRSNLLIVGGDNVRITGLRLRGPQREVHPWGEGYDRSGIMNASAGPPSVGRKNLEVDNCELFQWPFNAIYVGHGGTACVRNNYIHHNQRWKLGYGIGLQGGAKVSIEENLFAFNRHCVAGTGYPTQEYTARHNVVLASNNPPFDMHGLIESCPSSITDIWECEQTSRSFSYDVAGDLRVGKKEGEEFWHFGRSSQLSANEAQPPDNQIGGKKIHITHNTVASVTNQYKPMDLAKRKSLNAGRFGAIAAVYLRGVPWEEAVVENNSFAHPSRWGGAYKQVRVETDVKYTLPYNFNKSVNDNTNGVGNVWDHDNKYRRFFERFGDVFQKMEETTIPADGHFSFSSDRWSYPWSANSTSKLPSKVVSSYGLEKALNKRTWRVENGKATTKSDPPNDRIGEMHSKRFQINKNYVSFRLTGFKYVDIGSTGFTRCTENDSKYANQVALLSTHNDSVIFKANVPCDGSFVLSDHDLSNYQDSWAYFVLSDGDWHDGGWIEVGDIYFFDGPPAEPTNLRAEVNYREEDSSDNFTVKLSWDDPNNPSIRRWEYQWRERGGMWSEWQSIAWEAIDDSEENGIARIATQVSAPVNPLMTTMYEYKVRGYNLGGDGTASDSVAVKIFALPGRPENLTAAAANESVVLTWKAPISNGGVDITDYGYRYRATRSTKWSPSEKGTLLGQTTSHTVRPLTNGTEYIFEVWAVNKVGNGTSSSVKATPQAALRSVSFGSASYQAVEGGGPVSVLVRLSPLPSQLVRIPVQVSADEGTEADDYKVAGLTGGSVSFAPGVSEQSFTITANEDDDSDNETVSLSFETLGTVVRVTPEAKVMLLDNDATVVLSSLSPQVGTQLTAELADPSGGITNPRWQWQRRSSPTAKWINAAGVSSQPLPWVSIYLPQAGDVGYQLRATVSYTAADGTNRRAESPATAAVRAAPTSGVNRPPSAPLGPAEVSVAENTTAIGTYISADLDGDALGWTVSPSATFSVNGGVLSFKRAPDYESGTTVYTATLKTYDGALWSPSKTVTVRVTDVDDVAPVLDPVGPLTCYVGEYCSFTFPVASKGTAPITYKVSPPSWAKASGRSFSGTAPSSPGTASASLNASNAYGTDSESVAIKIKKRPVIGVAPVLDPVSPLTCYVGEYCSFTFPVARKGTSPITYKVSPPSWAKASGRSFSGTAPSSPGTASASLNASNSYGTDSESVTINIKRRPVIGVVPVLAAVNPITCYVGEYCSFTFPAATSGTAPITYKVSPPSWARASGSRGFAGAAPSSPGTFSASINASNAYGTDSESLTINVKKRGYRPVLPSVSSITCYVGEYCSFTFPVATSGTKPITYKVSPPSWARASGSRGFAGAAPSSPGTFSASLNASNAYGTDSESLTIKVKRRVAMTPRRSTEFGHVLVGSWLAERARPIWDNMDGARYGWRYRLLLATN